MNKRVSTRLSTTTSQAAFLHWTSHYLQSPLAAIAGYLDMLGDSKHRAQRAELLTQAQAATSRAQQVLGSIVALHKQLERSGAVSQTDAIDSVLMRATQFSGLRLSTPRQRTLPLACMVGDTAFDGLCLLFTTLKVELGVARVNIRYRQYGDELIVHLGFAKQTRDLRDVLGSLCALPKGRYPLIEGRYSPLATGVVLMRAAGLRCVSRPRSPRHTDLYIHMRLLRQLSLVDMVSDLG